MSVFHTAAESIAARLREEPSLAAITIVVDRQKDIAIELQKAIAKQRGSGLIVVTWTGAKNDDESADGPVFSSTYSVTLFSKPVLRAGETAADDLIETAAAVLHDYRPGGGHYHTRLLVKGIDPVPHDEFLIYQLRLSTPSLI